MRLTFLGTGSAMPTGERAQSGYLLDRGDRTLLVDCGSGVLQALARTGPGYEGVDALLVTHHHLDHVADLLPLLKARWLAGAGSLEIVGPPGTADLVADLLAVHEYLAEKVSYEARDVDAPGFSVADLDVRATATAHSAYCLAYRFGDALTLGGDSEADADLAAFADGCGTLVHDCSFPDDVDVSNHPTPSQLGAVLAGHEFGTVYLTHLYPHARGRETELARGVSERYNGDVRVARDGLTVKL